MSAISREEASILAQKQYAEDLKSFPTYETGERRPSWENLSLTARNQRILIEKRKHNERENPCQLFKQIHDETIKRYPEERSKCQECFMPVEPGEYHPYGACLMFKACKDEKIVRENLWAIQERSYKIGREAGEKVTPSDEANDGGN